MPDVLMQRPARGAAAALGGGALLAGALHDSGVETLFTLPGGHILPLLDACGDLGIRVIDTRHEGAATLAAEGWALATGGVGVAAVTAGPGFANGLVGLLDAGAWSVPLVMIAGRTAVTRQGRGAVMDIDQRAIAAPGVRWAASCVEAGRIPRYAAEAVHRARSGCPGAVYLDVPWDVLQQTPPALDVVPPGYAAAPARPAAPAEDIGAALAALRTAHRPLIVAGSGAFWSGAGKAITELSETSGIPVVTAGAARGVVPNSHPLCLGSLVHGGLAIPSADCVLLLGSAFNANVMYGSPPLFGAEQTVVQVDIDPARLGGNRAADVAVAGDAALVVHDLRQAWRGDRADPSWVEQARSLAAASLASWDRQVDEHGGTALHPGLVARELAAFAREVLGGEVTLVADGGDALSWGLAYFYAEKAGRLLTTTTALGTLGVGMPFALAAQVARPSEPVILFSGDGSFGLTAMEVDTAVRHGLPVVVVVANNAGWGDVRHEQDQFFGAGRRVASELQQTRYDRLGEALGARGEHVDRIDQLRPALQRALDARVCTVIDVTTDPAVLSDLLRMVASFGLM